MSPERTRFQKYETQRVHRSQLKNAPYNPRVMTAKQRGKLKKIIGKIGLIEPPVWNKRSGNIVGGHQRMGILDALEGKDDYSLDVAVVDMDDRQEKEANVALNNQAAMGDFDLDKLGKLFKDDKLDLDAAGFDMAELYQMFGDSPFAERPEALEQMAKTLEELQATSSKLHTALVSREDPDFYHVIVHRSSDDRAAYGRLLGMEEDNRYLDGRLMLELARENEALRAKLGLPPRAVQPKPEEKA